MFRSLPCIVLNPSSFTSYSKCWAVTNSKQVPTSFSQEQYNGTLPLSFPAYGMGCLQKPALHTHVQLEACSVILTNDR